MNKLQLTILLIAVFLGIQVHGIGTDSSKMGKIVKWKNMRIITRDIEKYLTPYKPVIIQKSFLTNKLRNCLNFIFEFC